MNDFYPILNELILSQLRGIPLVGSGQAIGMAQDIIDELATRFGGQTVYLKNNSAEKTGERHRRIVAEYDGTNRIALCRKYGISSVWLKKLLARAKNETAG